MSHSVDTWISDKIHLPSGTILLTGGVDEDMLELVLKGLHLLRGKPVNFLLNSDGGDETPGLGICDAISSHTARTSIRVVGSAESMAAVILQAADRRLITPSSYIMLHQGEVSTPDGHKRNVRAYLKISDKQDDICDELVLRRIQEKHPKYSWAKFREETNFDTYFSSEEALRWGLVDKVVR